MKTQSCVQPRRVLSLKKKSTKTKIGDRAQLLRALERLQSREDRTPAVLASITLIKHKLQTHDITPESKASPVALVKKVKQKAQAKVKPQPPAKRTPEQRAQAKAEKAERQREAHAKEVRRQIEKNDKPLALAKLQVKADKHQARSEVQKKKKGKRDLARAWFYSQEIIKRNGLLGVGIHKEFNVARAKAGIPAKELRAILHYYTQSTKYLKALAEPGARRVNFDGSDAGPVSAQHQADAVEALKERLPVAAGEAS